MISKRTHCAEQLHLNRNMFQCPVCGAAMDTAMQKSLVCMHGHTFDIAKQGYVNLLTRPIHTHYDKTLFEARRRIIVGHGFFDPLIEALAEQIMGLMNDSAHILDLGCGEGSHLAKICQLLAIVQSNNIRGFGADLAKEGIQSAAKIYPNQNWLVADLAYPPFNVHLFDFVLNILSPSNYHTFDRMLKPGGSIIKVIPGSEYLRELRFSLFGEEKTHYSNADTFSLFQQHFPNALTQKISYTIPLNQEGIRDLIQMTPLTWNVSEMKRKQWLEKSSATITVAFEILVGSKSH
ncbi:methyltransferase domain-containing protein [Sporolactobacillus shoreicorticis]|uniref:RNA methyltransferase n=1 Tax=Sporolactobacillus shoreicorticis TaxID=1923877 RepID=A0ABW5S5T3_9BACL|nr:methyltransferase domain-containing protein [Sporolactobacillus shoreicorticis]MCO7125658.1 methyltransferase domain-containing protein [Sporolactobacillus shoreicorticis]